MTSHDGEQGDWNAGEEMVNAEISEAMLVDNNQNNVPLLATSTPIPQGEPESALETFGEEENQYDSLYLYDGGSDKYASSEASSNSSNSSDLEVDETSTDKSVDSSLSGVPISRDGMAVCEKCGAVGVKHAFYSKSKRFCSLACSRSYQAMQKEGKTVPKPVPKVKFPMTINKTKKENVNPALAFKKTKRDLSNTFDWKPYFDMNDFVAAPVSLFKHAPLSENWDNIIVGMKVEVENHDYDPHLNSFPTSYWIASVVKLAGYKACLRYEGFGLDSSMDFWVSLCVKEVFPVGWCATQGKPLVPPKTIHNKYTDWKDFLVKRLTGSKTLPIDFYDKVQESLTSRFRPGMTLEVVDKNRINTTRVACVDDVVGGRIHVRYIGTDPDDEGFWCHERGPLVHAVGWSQMVGHVLLATPEYAKRSLQKAVLKKYDDNDVSWDMFEPVSVPHTELRFKEGMKLEAIDPLNLSAICVATVTKVMRNNYLMIGIDGYMSEKGLDSFCYHSTSPCLFPAGFCELNGIKLSPPRGYKGEFKWADYLKVTKSEAAPVRLFNQEPMNHGFEVGMRAEAVDLMEPRLICVGTIVKVIGRLMRIHFDGWDDNYDQWCDCESPDLYPVGWCNMVGYHLEPPRNMVVDSERKLKRGKPQIYKGQRKKKRGRPSGSMLAKPKTPLLKDTSGAGKLTTSSQWAKTCDVSGPESLPKNRLIPGDTGVLTEENGRKEVVPKEEEMTVHSTPATPVAVNGAQPEQSQTNSTPAPSNDDLEKWKKDGGLLSSRERFLPRMSAWSCIDPQHKIEPLEWSPHDVADFLRVNDCGSYADGFVTEAVSGSRLMNLSREQMVGLTGMKVGPSLKICSLIQQLKSKTS